MSFIESERLKLAPLTHTQLLLLQQSREKLELSMGLNPSNMLIAPIWEAELTDAITNWCIPKTLLYPDKYEWYTIWEVILKTTNVSMGSLGIGYPDNKGESIIGYSLDQNQQNKGYGTEALICLCKWGFLNPDVKAIWADTGADNYSSQRILTKAGFVQTGTRDELVIFKLRRT
jgi:ribosomal-protein-alanine N-acetyltransferase